MSKKQYIEAFSNIHPSDESIERIMSMTDKKHIVGFRRTLIVLVAVISIFCSAGLVANAVTDGAVTESVSETFEAVSKKIIVWVNGKETQAVLNVTNIVETTNADGEKCYVYEYNVDVDADTSVKFSIQCDDDTALDTEDYFIIEKVNDGSQTSSKAD